MAKQKTSKAKKSRPTKHHSQIPIVAYEHTDKKRLNNPPVGLVDAHSDNGGIKKKKYKFDPHINPQLDWAGKAEHTSFEIPTVSLHVHERIDPKRIIESVRKEPDDDGQISLFESQRRPLREAIEFYKHKENWSNRIIAGDSLLVMNSLLQKESLGGKIQMVYFDPPYGIRYKSNFQPFVDKKNVEDRDDDLTTEPEMLKAFRDTWELGIHSYLSYIRDRLLLTKELLHPSGSVFVQISDENIHRVMSILDEVFGNSNFVAIIPFRKKTMPLGSTLIEQMNNFLLFYAKDKEELKKKYRQLYFEPNVEGDFHWKWYELPDGSRHQMSDDELNNHSLLPDGARVFRLVSMWPPTFSQQGVFEVEFKGQKYAPPPGSCYPSNPEGMRRLVEANRLMVEGNYLRFVMYVEDNLSKLNALWNDTIGARNKRYVVQTSEEVVKRCVLMTSDPGDLVLDITCGSGTTAAVAEEWGRRWITCDTSRVAITVAKQRIMSLLLKYYQLAYPKEGVGSGFEYVKAHIKSLKSFTNEEPPEIITLYDRPLVERNKIRVTGPFTVEAVPAPVARSFGEDYEVAGVVADSSIVRVGETLRQAEWRDELLRSGVRAKGGKLIEFSRVEPLVGTMYLQAEGETKVLLESKNLFEKSEPTIFQQPQRVVICFGPEHAPLEQRTVELALDEAEHLKPKPHMVLFCAFQFDEEAAKDIDETNWPGVNLLKAQMNADLLTDDLKKKRSSNESFWLIGQPDVRKQEIMKGEDKGKYTVEVLGFDYYNPKNGTVESGGKGDIAMWMLDCDYDGRSLFPSQVFFPMAGEKEGWAALAKNLKAEIDDEKIEAFRGTVSLPFTPGKRVAVKIVDARGIESLKIIRM